MEIPFEMLSEDALQGLLEEFATREGTDYGHSAFSLSDKVRSVRRLLEAGEAVIVFDEESESCNIVMKRELRGKEG